MPGPFWTPATTLIGRLELAEHNPSVETLQRLAAGLGKYFVLTVFTDRQEE